MRLTDFTPFEIGGNTYRICPFSAFKASNLSAELGKVVAPLLGAIIPLFSEANEETELNFENLDVNKAGEALTAIDIIDGDKLECLIRKLLLGGHIRVSFINQDGNSEEAILDEDLVNYLFCGEIQDMYALCFSVVKLNFGSFFKKLPNPSGKVLGKVAKKRKVI